jgi:Protein of unknown function (DUF1186)
MDTTAYTSPLDKLLALGRPDPGEAEDWPNYLELGFSTEDIPELLRMVTDSELLEIDEEKPDGWAPIHALRVLGQLRDPSVIEPLLDKAEAIVDYQTGIGEWGLEELPEVFGMIGPVAIPMLTTYLADTSHDEYARSCCANGLEKIAIRHPEARSECIEALSHQLEVSAEDDYEENAFIIGHLAHLKAVEALPVIERAFTADKVDESIINWDDVQVELGLKEREPLTIAPFFKDLLLGNTETEADATPTKVSPPQIPPPLRIVRGPQPPLKFSGSHNKGKKKRNKKRK